MAAQTTVSPTASGHTIRRNACAVPALMSPPHPVAAQPRLAFSIKRAAS